eukprot:Nk52_evm83s207 gene=Nk52_evmTU83s207
MGFFSKSKDKESKKAGSSGKDKKSSSGSSEKLEKSSSSSSLTKKVDSLSLSKSSSSAELTSGIGKLHVNVIAARKLWKANAQPFCLIEFEHNQLITECSRGPEPTWGYSCFFDTNRKVGTVKILVYDRTTMGSGQEFLGGCTIDISTLDAELSEKWYRLESYGQREITSGELHVECAYTVSEVRSLSIEDFELLKVIGKGSFGKVMQVRKKDTGRVYAMKILKKDYIVARDEVVHTRAERKILETNTNPFLVGLKFSFQTKEKIYLVLDYINGGELFYHMQNDNDFSEERGRFYTAQLLLALEHLHKHDIIYRDLKPENILLDYTGYLALTDFGLCKENVGAEQKTNTFCGTPEYMAPEVLQQKGYGPAVDWWTLGILLYEMLAGLPPFYDENTNAMYHKILFSPLTFPPEMARPARSLITGLLEREPSKRLGYGKNGAQDIKSHEFFKGLNWDHLMKKKLVAPWRPKLASLTDTSNFDPEFTAMKVEDSVVETSQLSKTMQEQFKGFTFVDKSEMMVETDE